MEFRHSASIFRTHFLPFQPATKIWEEESLNHVFLICRTSPKAVHQNCNELPNFTHLKPKSLWTRLKEKPRDGYCNYLAKTKTISAVFTVRVEPEYKD